MEHRSEDRQPADLALEPNQPVHLERVGRAARARERAGSHLRLDRRSFLEGERADAAW
jgi:hypothetical protein